MRAKKSVVTVVLVGVGVTALTFVALAAATRARAQVSEEVGEDHSTTGARLLALTPDPVKFPVPRTQWDGKPDFSGVYWSLAYIPLGAETRDKAIDVLLSLTRPEVRAARAKLDREDSSGMHCWPETPATGSMHATLNVQLVSAPGFVAMINEYEANYRIIPTDGRAHDRTAKPTFQGDSVGHWEGDTLVVDVTNFKPRDKFTHSAGRYGDALWSDALHIVERWTRPDARFFEHEVVVEDPKMLTGPWTAPKIRRGLMAYDMAKENFCIPDEWLLKINSEQLEASKAGSSRERRTLSPR